MSQRTADRSLIFLTLIFILFVVFANEDASPRMAAFGDALPETTRAKAVYKVLYDFGIGGVVSLCFYILLVRLPEFAKRRRVRRSLERRYECFKEACLYTILGVVNGFVDTALADALLNRAEFRNYFNQASVIPEQHRWDYFLNNLNQDALNDILKEVDLLREEVNFVTSVIDINTDETFHFMKRFSAVTYDVQRTVLGYDSIKPLSIFLWSIYSGFDPAIGYEKPDFVSTMIRSI